MNKKKKILKILYINIKNRDVYIYIYIMIKINIKRK